MLNIYIGKFQPFHLGHEYIINKMLDTYAIKNLIFICGSSIDNLYPFTFEERKQMVINVLPKVKTLNLGSRIYFLENIYNDNLWCKNLYNIICSEWQSIYETKQSNLDPSLVTIWSGSLDDISYLNEYHLTSLFEKRILERDKIFDGLSATKIRESKDKKFIKKYTNKLNHNMILKKLIKNN